MSNGEKSRTGNLPELSDNFPTSARPIFIRMAILVAVLTAIFVCVHLQNLEQENQFPDKKLPESDEKSITEMQSEIDSLMTN